MDNKTEALDKIILDMEEIKNDVGYISLALAKDQKKLDEVLVLLNSIGI